MLDFLLPSLATASLALVLPAASGHLTHPGALRAALDQQDLVPRRARRVLTVGLGAAELAVGLAATVSLTADRWSAGAGLAVAAVGLGFTVFLVVLLLVRPSAPCGCHGADDDGVGPVDLARAGTVLAGGLALAAGAAGRLHDLGGSETATVLLAGVAWAAAVDVTSRSQRRLSPLT